MVPKSPTCDIFILSAFDRDQWCPVLQTRFRVDDLEALRSILGEHATEDIELRHNYLLDDDELSAVTSRLPSFLHRAKDLSEDANTGQHLGEAFD
jgi:hypothetical protein